MAVHTIFVPEGWSVEQAWEAIKRGEKEELSRHPRGVWVNVDENGKLIT